MSVVCIYQPGYPWEKLAKPKELDALYAVICSYLSELCGVWLVAKSKWQRD